MTDRHNALAHAKVQLPEHGGKWLVLPEEITQGHNGTGIETL